MSAMKLPSSTSTAVIRFSAISSEYSRAVMALMPSVPKPGQLKMDSTMYDPPSSPGSDSPKSVIIGMRALRSAWTKITRFSPKPLARAVRMKSSWITSSILERA